MVTCLALRTSHRCMFPCHSHADVDKYPNTVSAPLQHSPAMAKYARVPSTKDTSKSLSTAREIGILRHDFNIPAEINEGHSCKAWNCRAPSYLRLHRHTPPQSREDRQSADPGHNLHTELCDGLDEVKGISLLLYLLMVRMKLKLTKQCQEPLSLIDNFN
jgi:hypothetical protein